MTIPCIPLYGSQASSGRQPQRTCKLLRDTTKSSLRDSWILLAGDKEESNAWLIEEVFRHRVFGEYYLNNGDLNRTGYKDKIGTGVISWVRLIEFFFWHKVLGEHYPNNGELKGTEHETEIGSGIMSRFIVIKVI